MNIQDEKKIDLLSAQLQERYSAMHNMRGRSMQFTLWILGLGLGLAWLTISETLLTRGQQWAITALVVMLALAAFCFLSAIARGFRSNREIVIRAETALGLYEPGYYGIQEAILPDQFSRSRTGRTGHFFTLYMLVAAVLLMLLVFIWTNPCASVTASENGVRNGDTVKNSRVQD